MKLALVMTGLIGAAGIPPHASLTHFAIQGAVSVAIMAAGAWLILQQESKQ